MNMIVIFEDPATKHCQESKPYLFATALHVPCLCGNLIHPIAGAWCTQCGLKVLEVRTDFAANKGHSVAGGHRQKTGPSTLRCI